MIAGGQTEARTSTIIDYHAPFDQGLSVDESFFLYSKYYHAVRIFCHYCLNVLWISSSKCLILVLSFALLVLPRNFVLSKSQIHEKFK